MLVLHPEREFPLVPIEIDRNNRGVSPRYTPSLVKIQSESPRIFRQNSRTMPEVRFQIRWPDGTEEICYSPSLVVKQYLESGIEYELSDFLERSRAALREGSDRVKAKFGYPCGLALGQLQSLENTATRYSDRPAAKVKLLKYIE